MKIIQDSIGDEEACVYLSDQRARMHYRAIEHCTSEAYMRMLQRGWRRFGRVFFRPVCEACEECRSLRIPVDDFRPNRSMRRAWKANEDLGVHLRRPSMTDQHLKLYGRYHADMAERKAWREKEVAPFEYYYTFVDAQGEFGHELLFVDPEHRLLGVALVDILPKAISAVYCFYEPLERHRSLGVYSVLRQIELAKQRGISHLYLGYWVEPNASMSYKARYRPHELLTARCEDDTEPDWRPPLRP